MSDIRENPPAGLDKSSERVRRMFGSIAGRYDLLNHLLSLGIDRSWRRRTVRLVPPQPGVPILDVCTGTGDLAIAYWKASGRTAKIVATDFCPPMLEIARQKARRAGGREPYPLAGGRHPAIATGDRLVPDRLRGFWAP